MNVKKLGRKIHRFILKAITGLSVALLLVSLLSVDGPYWKQALLGLAVSIGWIVVFTWGNYEGEEDGK
jgi:hypothetical protein